MHHVKVIAQQWETVNYRARRTKKKKLLLHAREVAESLYAQISEKALRKSKRANEGSHEWTWRACEPSHRAAALESCAFLIDWLKTKAPFWKREEFAGGAARWVEAKAEDDAAAARWAR